MLLLVKIYITENYANIKTNIKIPEIAKLNSRRHVYVPLVY
jgi:hypothetical protein